MNEKGSSASTTSKDGPRKCKECKVTLPNIYDYADHLESAEHRKGVMKSKYGPKYLKAKALMDGKSRESSKSNDDRILSSNDDDDDDDDVYTCEICEKVCTGILNYNLHMSGQKHHKKVKSLKILKQLKEDNFISDDENFGEDDTLSNVVFPENEFTPSGKMCKICNKKCSGPEVFKQHINSEGHKKKLKMQHLLKDSSLKTTESDDSNDENPSCDICKKVFSGPLPYQQHLQSSSHKKKVEETKTNENFKELMVSTDDGRKAKCNECNKVFTSAKHLRDHFKSSMHSRLKLKNELMTMIEDKHPEMIISSENDEDGRKIDLIFCSVCKTAFSGPESARDHVESQKHAKAVKKKAEIKRLKQAKRSEQSNDVSDSAPDSDKIVANKGLTKKAEVKQKITKRNEQASDASKSKPDCKKIIVNEDDQSDLSDEFTLIG